ncbi:MAG: hypothetical protein AB1656_12365 [Candidatus Omnitrophota bacterium]
MNQAAANDYRSMVPHVRGIIGYFCVIAIFGCISLIVHASLEEKKIRYRMTEKNFEKMRLLEEIRQLNNRIGELESYQRIAGLIQEQLPQLGPPRNPAVELAAPGLRSGIGFSDYLPMPPEKEGFFDGLRRGWDMTRKETRSWLQSLVE